MPDLNLIKPNSIAFKNVHSRIASKTISILSQNNSNDGNCVDKVTIKLKLLQDKVVIDFYQNLSRWNNYYNEEIDLVSDTNEIKKYIASLNNNELAILSTHLCYSSGTQNAGIVELLDIMLEQQHSNGLKILNVFIEQLKSRLSLIQINKLNTINADQYNLEKNFMVLLATTHQTIANITRLGSTVDLSTREIVLNQQLDLMVEECHSYSLLLKGKMPLCVEKHHSVPFAIGFAEGYIKNSSPLSRELAVYSDPADDNMEIMLYNNIFRVSIASLLSAAKDGSKQLVDSTLNQLILIHKKYCLHILKQLKQNDILISPLNTKFIKKFLMTKRGNVLVNLFDCVLRRDTDSLAKFKEIHLANTDKSNAANTTNHQIYMEYKKSIVKDLQFKPPLNTVSEVKAAYKVLLEYKDYKCLAEYLGLLTNKIESSCNDEFKSQVISLVFKKNGLKAGLLDHLSIIKKTTEDANVLAILERCIKLTQSLLHQHEKYKALIGYEYSDFILLLTQKTFISKQAFLQASSINAYAIAKNTNLTVRQKNSLRNFMLKQLDNRENCNFDMLHKKRTKFISNLGISSMANGCSNLKYDLLAVDNSISHNHKNFNLGPKTFMYGLSQLLSTLLSGLLPSYYNVSDTCTSRSIKQIWSNYLEPDTLVNQNEINSDEHFEVLQNKIKSLLQDNKIGELINELKNFNNKVLLYSVLTIRFNDYCPLEQMISKTQKCGQQNELLNLLLISAKAYFATANRLNVGASKSLIDSENWSLNKFLNYMAKVKPQNSHEALVESALILSIIEADSDLSRQSFKRKHFTGIITRLADNSVSHFKPLRQKPLQISARNRIIFKTLVATIATIAGVLLVASGIGTPAVIGVFLIMGICKSILNSMSEVLDFGDTAEYMCIRKLLVTEDNDTMLDIGSVKRDLDAKNESLTNWWELLNLSNSVISAIDAPGAVKEDLTGIVSEAYSYGKMLGQDDSAPRNKDVVDNKNYSATYPLIKQMLKLANKDNLSKENSKEILANYFKHDVSYFTQLDRGYLNRINELLAKGVLSADIEVKIKEIFLEIQNQVVDKYTATQAIFRWVAILSNSNLSEDYKSTIFKKLLEEFKQQKHPLAKILLQHRNISSKRKYFIYDIVIGALTGFIDMVGLHVFDFTSVGQMAISGAASSINTLTELSRQKDTQKIKTQSFKNVVTFLDQLIVLNKPVIAEVN